MGQYNLAERVANAPIGLFSSFANVFYFHGKEGLGKIKKTIYGFTFGVLAFSGVLSAILLVFGRELFSLLFDSSWSLSGQLAAYLIISQSILCLTTSFTRFTDILNQQRNVFFLQVTCAAIVVSELLLLRWLECSMETTALTFSLTIAIYNAIWLLFLVSRSDLSLKVMSSIMLCYPTLYAIAYIVLYQIKQRLS